MSDEINPGSVLQESFGSSQMSVSASTSDTAVAAHTQAQVQARYIMALRRPRSWADVRVRILVECRRPSFAASAMYKLPRGGETISGLGIRFAEAALRCMTNVHVETVTIYDDRKKRIIRVQATDLESNLTYGQDITVEKTVERSKLTSGQQPVGKRTNSYGKTVFIVEANDGELQQKEGVAISKAMRNEILRLLPGDIQDEAKAAILNTGFRDASKDPQAAIKALCDAFMALNVKPSQLTEYLGQEVDSVSPAEVVELRAIYAAIRNGDTTWRDVMDNKTPDGAPDEPSDKATSFKDRLKKKAHKDKQADGAERPQDVGSPLQDAVGADGAKETMGDPVDPAHDDLGYDDLE